MSTKRYRMCYQGTALAVSRKACQELCRAGDAEAALLYLYLTMQEGMLDIAQAAHDLHKTPEAVDAALRELAAAGAIEPSDLPPISAVARPQKPTSAQRTPAQQPAASAQRTPAQQPAASAQRTPAQQPAASAQNTAPQQKRKLPPWAVETKDGVPEWDIVEGVWADEVPKPRLRRDKPSTGLPQGVVISARHPAAAIDLPEIYFSPDMFYTSQDIARAAQGDRVFRWLVSETEKCLGRALRQHEAEKLMMIYEDIHLSAEVIPLLVRYVGGENPARDGISFSRLLTEGRRWAERGVYTVEDAERMIQSQKERESLFGKLLCAAGVYGRSPSTTERRYVESWVDAGYTQELVEKAYDITVTKTGGVNWKYTSAILSRWSAKGIRTAEDVERVEGSARRGYYHKTPAPPSASAEAEEAMYAQMRENYLKDLSKKEGESHE